MIGRRRRLPIAAMALVLAAAAPATAHKFYASLAQVEHTGGRLEVALRFFPDDLEAALRATSGARVAVEPTRAFGAAFEPWLNARFALEAGGRRTRFTYVGAEVSAKTAWVYVEAAWTDALDRSAMTNTLLVDLYPEQVNTVNFVDGSRRSSRVFSASLTRAARLMDAPR